MKKIFKYLSISEKIEKVDLIIGFGHFDLRIPELCCELYSKGYGKRILFTGGIGAGTADLGQAEAQAFNQVAIKNKIPENKVIIEDKSTNTSENIDFSMELIKNLPDKFIFKSAILVASPYRQRRVYLACRKKLPGVKLINHPPKSSLEEDVELFRNKNQNLKELLLGEIDRIIKYGERGWIEKEKVPVDILQRVK